MKGIAIVTKVFERCKIEICGISELRGKAKGHFMMDRYAVYFSRSEKRRENGIAFILAKGTKCVLGYNPVSNRIITICL